MSRLLLALIAIFFWITDIAHAQMERERVQTDGPVEETFWTPNLVGMSTVEPSCIISASRQIGHCRISSAWM